MSLTYLVLHSTILVSLLMLFPVSLSWFSRKTMLSLLLFANRVWEIKARIWLMAWSADRGVFCSVSDRRICKNAWILGVCPSCSISFSSKINFPVSTASVFHRLKAAVSAFGKMIFTISRSMRRRIGQIYQPSAIRSVPFSLIFRVILFRLQREKYALISWLIGVWVIG